MANMQNEWASTMIKSSIRKFLFFDVFGVNEANKYSRNPRRVY